jgi:hypothetical protein
LQKFGCKKLALKLDSFGNETPRGDWLAICTLKQGVRWTLDWMALDVQGTILNVAPVSNKYLLFVNSSIRKMRPAFPGKCMAVAVACVDSTSEPLRVRRRFYEYKQGRMHLCDLLL